MNPPWAMLIPLEHARAAGLLRCMPDIEACVSGDLFCLRGSALTDVLDSLLPHILGERFRITTEKNLIPRDGTLPIRTMPQGPWQPIADLLTPQLGATSLPGATPPKLSFDLVHSIEEAPANFMLAPWQTFRTWAATAPALRLRPLRFALSDETAAIHGTPLPNIPAQRFIETNGIAIPCGSQLAPAIPLAIVAETLGLSPGDIAVLTPHGGLDLLRAEFFVPVTRSSIRLSEEMLNLPEGRA